MDHDDAVVFTVEKYIKVNNGVPHLNVNYMCVFD